MTMRFLRYAGTAIWYFAVIFYSLLASIAAISEVIGLSVVASELGSLLKGEKYLYITFDSILKSFSVEDQYFSLNVIIPSSFLTYCSNKSADFMFLLTIPAIMGFLFFAMKAGLHFMQKALDYYVGQISEIRQEIF